MTFGELEGILKADELIEGLSNIQKYRVVKGFVEKGVKDTKFYDPFMLGVFDSLYHKYHSYTEKELKELFMKKSRSEESTDSRKSDPEYKHGFYYANKVFKASISTTIGDIVSTEKNNMEQRIKSKLQDLLHDYMDPDVIDPCVEECLEVMRKFLYTN